ncbi:hypothetical protein RchiOBHm_Chr6g0252301 [Rosa chinensis]|uniref:DUF247 domain protein n=1 Tax=Rosa chinensis TaxID=74649 RepID=A0A2P6PL21_ROSCH|nr:UPF0481 protein At3g47200 [Rosa chinensis]PRQ22621.1 hypothetical protein RchiOBHm_Chr6g0252301 [Rosa chinensis]
MGELQPKNLKQKLEKVSPLSPRCCIYRVPKRLRNQNEKAYTPQVVSIGPLHHGGKDLEAMEDHKIRYVKDFLERTKVSMEECFNALKEWETEIRACYAVKIEYEETELVEMVLVDSIFIFELLLRFPYPALQKEKVDRVFGKPWMQRDITYDLLLLENQIPFFILEYLYSLALTRNTIPLEANGVLSLFELTHRFLGKSVYIWPYAEMKKKLEHKQIQHFVDFVLTCHRPLPSELPNAKKLTTLTIPNATELYQSGVKFVKVDDKNIFDIKFKNGVLKIPHLRIRGSTEIFFRNLIAYEQCEFHDHYFHDYVFIMDGLVDSSKDVDLLVKAGILDSKLPDSEATASFISSLDSGPILFSKKSYVTDLCDALNAYYRVPQHKWKASLKQDYFSTPWAGLSIVVAAILVVLTFIQTVCSIMSL